MVSNFELHTVFMQKATEEAAVQQQAKRRGLEMKPSTVAGKALEWVLRNKARPLNAKKAVAAVLNTFPITFGFTQRQNKEARQAQKAADRHFGALDAGRKPPVQALQPRFGGRFGGRVHRVQNLPPNKEIVPFVPFAGQAFKLRAPGERTRKILNAREQRRLHRAKLKMATDRRAKAPRTLGGRVVGESNELGRLNMLLSHIQRQPTKQERQSQNNAAYAAYVQLQQPRLLMAEDKRAANLLAAEQAKKNMMVRRENQQRIKELTKHFKTQESYRKGQIARLLEIIRTKKIQGKQRANDTRNTDALSRRKANLKRVQEELANLIDSRKPLADRIKNAETRKTRNNRNNPAKPNPVYPEYDVPFRQYLQKHAPHLARYPNINEGYTLTRKNRDIIRKAQNIGGKAVQESAFKLPKITTKITDATKARNSKITNWFKARA